MLELRNITYEVDDNNENKEILKNVSVTIDDHFVAITGPNGGGKSTLAKMIAGIIRPTSGQILLDNHDVRDYNRRDLRKAFGMVLQDTWLYKGTIMENIRYGRLDATDEEVIAAARLANCEEFAAKLPDGYNSMIGENGCELSGGERQRISIARAFLKNSPIILLDEATASLDVENETLIQAALSKLIKDKTVLVIAHRMRTVSGADKVVVLSNGMVAEQGTPEGLMNTGKIYPHMVKLQMISSDWGI